MRKLLLGVLVTTLLLFTACSNGGGDSADDTSGLDPETRELAQQLYRTGNSRGATACQSCHTLDGTALVGPSFQGVANVAAERQPELSAEEYMRQSITQPGSYVVEGYDNAMPANYDDTLNENEIDALVQWLLTFDEGASE